MMRRDWCVSVVGGVVLLIWLLVGCWLVGFGFNGLVGVFGLVF